MFTPRGLADRRPRTLTPAERRDVQMLFSTSAYVGLGPFATSAALRIGALRPTHTTKEMSRIRSSRICEAWLQPLRTEA